jgi:ATP-dependent protease ClpP protease subunit
MEDERKDRPNNPIPDQMMERRTVMLGGEINDKSIGEIGHRLVTLQLRSEEPINLIIDSTGGSSYAALGLCDLMTTILRTPMRGIVCGRCDSAATFVLLHCKERLSTPYSRFLIHSGTANKISFPINETSSENVKRLLKELERIEEAVIKLYMDRLTPPAWAREKPSDEARRVYVRQLIQRGDQIFNGWLSAEEAVEVGLVERVLREPVDIFKKEKS